METEDVPGSIAEVVLFTNDAFGRLMNLRVAQS